MPNGNIIASGYVDEPSSSGANIWLGKFDPYFNVISSAAFNGPDNGNDYGKSFYVDGSENIYLAGEIRNTGGNQAGRISKHPPLVATPPPDGNVLGTSSVTWSWTNVPMATGYQLLTGLYQIVSGLLPAGTVSYTETGLTPNTLYRRRIRAVEGYQELFSGPGDAYTRAAVPLNAGVTSVSGGAATFFWSANGNPDGTIYRAERSENGLSYSEFYTGTSTSAVANGLTGGITYYFRVRAENTEGYFTSYSNVADTAHPQSPPEPPPPEPGVPTVVTVSGRQLLVAGSPFTVKGLAYSPIPAGQNITYDWSADADTLNADMPILKAMGANTVRLYKAPTQRSAMDLFNSNGLYVIMGMDISPNVDLSDPGNRTDIINEFISMVRRWKNHPAVMMWCFGNEVNAHANGLNNPAWYSLLQEAATAAHAEDTNHPVTTANADVASIGNAALGANDASLTALDLWGANLYKGGGTYFNDAFTSFASSSTKPLLILEFGSDAFNSSSGNKEDQTSQASIINNQWGLAASPGSIINNLSATNPSKVCVGGVVFEYSDEWWKFSAGDQGTHDTQYSWTNSSYTDSYISEEWWGIVALTPGSNVRNLRTAFSTLRTLWGGTAPIPAEADILTLYSDKGLNATNIFTWSGGGTGQFDGLTTEVTPPEGRQSFKTTMTGGSAGYAGWGVVYDSSHNLNAYKGGALRFWIKTTTRDVKIEIENWSGVNIISSYVYTLPGWSDTYLNQWVLMDLDILTSYNMSAIKLPFKATMTGINGDHSFFIDQVRYVKSKTTPYLNVRMKNRSDNTEATSLTWIAPTLPSRWGTADQYLEIDLEPGNRTNWGLQIYTNNRSATANPRYTGPAGSNPCGLIDTTTSTWRLPLAWRAIEKTTTTITVVTDDAGGLFSQELGGVSGGYRCFQWMKDLSTPDIPTMNTTAFVPGEDGVTVWNNEGMHFAEGDRIGNYWGSSWAPIASPLYIYLAADFLSAHTPRQYNTSTLTLELFSE
ncbi:MAG: hypothetical protein HY548_01365 [Elusimicrobia bacterium]|nr:hypothetical protein [Elusimicrobiota bacterium]